MFRHGEKLQFLVLYGVYLISLLLWRRWNFISQRVYRCYLSQRYSANWSHKTTHIYVVEILHVVHMENVIVALVEGTLCEDIYECTEAMLQIW